MEFYHFAFLDTNDKVVNVAVFDSENPDADLLNAVKEQSGAVNYKSCTVYGDAFVDALFFDNRFIYQQPYPSWILNLETYEWESPVGLPIDNTSVWNEETLSWIPIIEIE